MKQIFTLFILLTLGCCWAANAQRFMPIPNDPSNPVDIVPFIEDDTLADGSHDMNTIYQLENGGVYLFQSRLVNEGWPLRIHATDTSNTALKPFLVRSPDDDGVFRGEMRPEGDFEMINLWVTWGAQTGNANHQWGRLRASADSIRMFVKDCIFEKDRGGMPQIRANGVKLYYENNIVRSAGNRRVQQGNGRGVDARNFAMDTVVVKNTVFHNLQDRVFRSLGATAPHNYIEFDHVTVFNQHGRHGTFSLGFGAKTVKITNSILSNPMMLGMSPIYNEEQTHLDKDNKFVFAIDGEGRVDSLSTSFTFDNNNIFWTQDVLDFYASNDTVSQVGIFSSEIANALGAGADTTYFSEVLEFNNVPLSILPYVQDVYADPASTEMFDFIVEPSNSADVDTSFIGYENLYDFTQFDIGYSEESTSFTAASDGGAVGARFGDFGAPQIPTGIRDEIIQTVLVYPNPSTDRATFRYHLKRTEEIALVLTDLNGRDIAMLDQGVKSAGSHEVTVNLGQYLTNNGIYLARFKSSDQQKVMRLVYIKR